MTEFPDHLFFPTGQFNATSRRYELLQNDISLEQIQEEIIGKGSSFSSLELASRSSIAKTLNPGASLKQLRLNRAEEWFGRARPECLVDEQNVDWLAATIQTSADEDIDANQSKFGWEKGIGTGKKDEANLTGYWRFGEGLKATPRNASSAQLVCPQMLEDISGFSRDTAAEVHHSGSFS